MAGTRQNDLGDSATVSPGGFRDYLEQVRQQNPLLDVIQETDPLSSGRSWLCPFHPDSRPSLSVTPDGQRWRCFGCGAGGDVFAWVEKRRSLAFLQAVHYLARRAGLPEWRSGVEPDAAQAARDAAEAVRQAALYYYAALRAPGGDAARRYLTEERRLPAELLDRFQVGWAGGTGLLPWLAAQPSGAVWRAALERVGLMHPARQALTWAEPPTWREAFRGRVVFPTLNPFGAAVHLTARALDPAVEPKYLHQRGPAPLYNGGALTRPRHGGVWVVEGPVDTLSLEAWGYPTVGLQGGMRASALRPLRAYTGELWLVPDGDAAGPRWAIELAAAAGPERCVVVELPAGSDPNDFYRAAPERPERLAARPTEGPVAYALRHLATPAEAPPSRRLTGIVKLLAAFPRLEAEAALTGVAQALGLRRAARAALAATVEDARQAARRRCPACGEVFLVPDEGG